MKISNTSIVIGCVVAITAIWFHSHDAKENQDNPTSSIGVSAKATKQYMQSVAETLVKAQSKGDAAAAMAIMDELIAAMDKITDGASAGKINRDCQLASAHLADGVMSVAKGQAWQSRSQFKATVADCN